MPHPAASRQHVVNATRNKAIPFILADDAAQIGYSSHPPLLSLVHTGAWEILKEMKD